jgi:hypothetical protein
VCGAGACIAYVRSLLLTRSVSYSPLASWCCRLRAGDFITGGLKSIGLAIAKMQESEEKAAAAKKKGKK